MDAAALIQLVRASALLTDAEREYWLQNLPSMTPAQCKKLEAILGAPNPLPFQAELEQYFDALGKAAEAAIRQSVGANKAA